VYDLYIANKNYSSWSLRPWILMRELGVPFREHLAQFGATTFREFSPTGKVPCLRDGDVLLWDSLAITEYLAESHPSVWPSDVHARAWARCAAAEMHSGFGVLRDRCSMTCGLRIKLHETPPALVAELARLGELWQEGLARFGGRTRSACSPSRRCRPGIATHSPRRSAMSRTRRRRCGSGSSSRICARPRAPASVRSSACRTASRARSTNRHAARATSRGPRPGPC